MAKIRWKSNKNKEGKVKQTGWQAADTVCLPCRGKKLRWGDWSQEPEVLC